MNLTIAIFGIVSLLMVFLLVRNTLNFIKSSKDGGKDSGRISSTNLDVNKDVKTSVKVQTAAAKPSEVKQEAPAPETARSGASGLKTAALEPDFAKIPINIQGSGNVNEEVITRVEGILKKRLKNNPRSENGQAIVSGDGKGIISIQSLG